MSETTHHGNPRRNFMTAASALLAAACATGYTSPREQRGHAAAAPPPHDMSSMPPSWTGHEQIGMVMYPGMTALDFVGPQYMLASLMGATVHHVAATRNPVLTDTGLALMPTTTFEELPQGLDVLFVPGGGQGTLTAMQDPATLKFLQHQARSAKLVASVCTGSLLLGAAGLLNGYKATTHWVATSLLPLVGATPVNARVVQDRDRVTAAGVSAGLDLGLLIVARLRDARYAQAVQLLAEYAPEPPFTAGTPATAPPDVVELVGGMFKEFLPQASNAIATAKAYDLARQTP